MKLLTLICYSIGLTLFIAPIVNNVTYEHLSALNMLSKYYQAYFVSCAFLSLGYVLKEMK